VNASEPTKRLCRKGLHELGPEWDDWGRPNGARCPFCWSATNSRYETSDKGRARKEAWLDVSETRTLRFPDGSIRETVCYPNALKANVSKAFSSLRRSIIDYDGSEATTYFKKLPMRPRKPCAE
jgi:hypothetical protein